MRTWGKWMIAVASVATVTALTICFLPEMKKMIHKCPAMDEFEDML